MSTKNISRGVKAAGGVGLTTFPLSCTDYLEIWKPQIPENLRTSPGLYMVSFTLLDGFGGLVVRMLASGSRVRGFKPGRSRWIFLYIKILSMPSFGGEVK
jgi:hypothetical protein